MPHSLIPPFAYFGGKRRASGYIWPRFGQPTTYIEPFFGSGCVLLGNPNGAPEREIVNDIDGLLTNFWRALKADPECTAYHADYPTSHLDLIARNHSLLDAADGLTARLRQDPDYCDFRLAGWWVWSVSNSIPMAVSPANTRPFVLNHPGGQGIQAARRDLGPNPLPLSGQRLREWFQVLSDRLWRTTILCCDWSRVVTGELICQHLLPRHPCAIFFDPPYATQGRHNTLYRMESTTIAQDVQQWALEHQDTPGLLICVAGYAADYGDWPDAWERVVWSTHQGRMGGPKDEQGYARTECLWFSPQCLKSHSDAPQMGRLLH